jgi:Sec-independent protein translocase protein TatA
MIANIGDLPYLVIIAVIVLIAGSQLPKIARNVGIAGKEFRKAQQEAEEDAEKERQAKAAKEPPPPAALTPPPVQMGPVPQAPMPQAAPVAAAPQVAAPSGPPAGPAAGSPSDGAITLTPAQLDALLKAREDQVKRDAAGGTNN